MAEALQKYFIAYLEKRNASASVNWQQSKDSNKHQHPKELLMIPFISLERITNLKGSKVPPLNPFTLNVFFCGSKDCKRLLLSMYLSV